MQESLGVGGGQCRRETCEWMALNAPIRSSELKLSPQRSQVEVGLSLFESIVISVVISQNMCACVWRSGNTEKGKSHTESLGHLLLYRYICYPLFTCIPSTYHPSYICLLVILSPFSVCPACLSTHHVSIIVSDPYSVCPFVYIDSFTKKAFLGHLSNANAGFCFLRPPLLLHSFQVRGPSLLSESANVATAKC